MTSGIDAGQVSVKLFEQDQMVFAKFKNGEWVDSGRGKLRAWKKGNTAWLSFISVGTKRELLACHTFGSQTIDNRIIFATEFDADSRPTSQTDCQLDPLPFEEGLVVHSASKIFLFRSLGSHAHSDDETGPSSPSQESDSDVDAHESEDEESKNMTAKEKRVFRLIRTIKQHIPVHASKTLPQRNELQSFDENE